MSKIGDLRIVSFKHPDSLNQTVWNVEQRILSIGQYSIPGSSHWSVTTIEPFDVESEAKAFMEEYIEFMGIYNDCN